MFLIKSKNQCVLNLDNVSCIKTSYDSINNKYKIDFILYIFGENFSWEYDSATERDTAYNYIIDNHAKII